MITFVKYRRGGLSFFIKAFCQNGWINRNWEPWRYYRWIWTIKVAKTTIFVENINTTHWRKRLFHCTLRKIIRDNPLKDYLLKYIAKHTQLNNFWLISLYDLSLNSPCKIWCKYLHNVSNVFLFFVNAIIVAVRGIFVGPNFVLLFKCFFRKDVAS